MTLPVIGVLEGYGLRQRAIYLVRKLSNLKTGGILIVYILIRQIIGALSIRISGQQQFVRSIVNPMAQVEAKNKFNDIDEVDNLKVVVYTK